MTTEENRLAPSLALEEYLARHSPSEPELLHELRRRTHLTTIQPRMMSSWRQGELLRMLTMMCRPRLVLEVGTFTGYGALCLASALEGEGHLHTIERNDELRCVIEEFVVRSGLGARITLHIGTLAEALPGIEGDIDLCFVDGDKREYQQYHELLLPRMRSGGILLYDNTLWDGQVLAPARPGDAHTSRLQAFNDALAKDPRVEALILPLRDGLTICRKK